MRSPLWARCAFLLVMSVLLQIIMCGPEPPRGITWRMGEVDEEHRILGIAVLAMFFQWGAVAQWSAELELWHGRDRTEAAAR